MSNILEFFGIYRNLQHGSIVNLLHYNLQRQRFNSSNWAEWAEILFPNSIIL